MTELHIFTDGLCSDPTKSHTRRSAWAVVVFNQPYGAEPGPNAFVTAATAHTQGEQTISRAELWAVAWIVIIMAEHYPSAKFHIYTDSQYVYDSILDIDYGILTKADQNRAYLIE